jgi:hypothetical protein
VVLGICGALRTAAQSRAGISNGVCVGRDGAVGTTRSSTGRTLAEWEWEEVRCLDEKAASSTQFSETDRRRNGGDDENAVLLQRGVRQERDDGG